MFSNFEILLFPLPSLTSLDLFDKKMSKKSSVAFLTKNITLAGCNIPPFAILKCRRLFLETFMKRI